MDFGILLLSFLVTLVIFPKVCRYLGGVLSKRKGFLGSLGRALIGDNIDNERKE